MAFHIGISDVRRTEKGRSIAFTLFVESHAIIAGGDGSPSFHTFDFKDVKAWKGPGGRIAINANDPRLSMSHTARITVAAILSRMPEVRSILKVDPDAYADELQEAYTGSAKRLWRA